MGEEKAEMRVSGQVEEPPLRVHKHVNTYRFPFLSLSVSLFLFSYEWVVNESEKLLLSICQPSRSLHCMAHQHSPHGHWVTPKDLTSHP